MDNQDGPVLTMPPPEFPRFGIRHMLLWAVCLAVVMPVAKIQLGRYHGVDTAHLTAFWITVAIRFSAALMALPILVSRRWRGLQFPEHPGDRYWLIDGIMTAMRLMLMTRLLSERWESSMLLFVSLSLLWLAMLLHACWRVGRGPWRWYFGVEAAFALMRSLEWLQPLISPDIRVVFMMAEHIELPILAPIVAGVICIAIDRRHGRRYPWTHWWGVGLLLATGIEVVWRIVAG